MVTEKNLNDLIEAKHIILNAVDDFYHGKSYAYKIVSVELRKILCDTNRKKDVSLFHRLFPDIKFLPISGYSLPDNLKHDAVYSLPLKIQYDGKGVSKASLSLDSSCRISKDEWIKQNIVDSEITIEQFIRSISDKEGAHSDPEIELFIRKVNSLRIGNEETYKYLIVAIGEYIAIIIDKIVEINGYENSGNLRRSE